MAMDDYHEYSGLKVRKLVKIANDELDAEAMYELGYRYCFGFRMRPNKRKALYWMLGAAYLDDPVAQYLVGTMYVFGEGTPVDFTEAVYWFGVAADQGHAPSRDTHPPSTSSESCTPREWEWKPTSRRPRNSGRRLRSSAARKRARTSSSSKR